MLSVSTHEAAWQQWAPPGRGAENLLLAALSPCPGSAHTLWMLIYSVSYSAEQTSWGAPGEQESHSKYCQVNKAPKLHGLNQSTSDTIPPTEPARGALSPMWVSPPLQKHLKPASKNFIGFWDSVLSGSGVNLVLEAKKKSSPLSATANICGSCGNADEGVIHKRIQVQFHETPAGSQMGVRI